MAHDILAPWAEVVPDLAAGISLVWVIWPKYEQVDVWRPGSVLPMQTLTMGDTLNGLDVLPGFTYPLADLFA